MNLECTNSYELTEDINICDGAVFHHLGLILREKGIFANKVFIKDPIQRVEVAFVKIGGLVVEAVVPNKDGDSPINAALKDLSVGIMFALRYTI